MMAATSAEETPAIPAETAPYTIDEPAPSSASKVDPPSSALTPAVESTPEPSHQPIAVAETPASPTPAAREPLLPAREPAPPHHDGADPVVDQLAAMFSTLDRETIEDVLASNHGHADAAVPQLLELSGQAPASPRGASPPLPARPAQPRNDDDDLRRAQEMADEEFARQLMQEEQQAAQQYGQLNYQPRQTRPGGGRGADGQPIQPGPPDQLDQAFEKLQVAAEKSRQVATGWFKQATAFAKDKMAQFDQPKQGEAQYHESDSFQLPSSSQGVPATPAVASTPRTAPALPHGDRYARPANPPAGYTTASPAAQPSFGTAMSSQPPERERISMVDNTRPKTQDKRAEDSDEDEAEFTRSPFEED